MAIALPASPGLSASSTIVAEYGLAVDYTDDGAQRSRDLYGAQYYRLTLVWEALLPAERVSLEAWLRRYRSTEIEVDLGGEVYSGRLIADPEIRWQGPTRATIQVQLRGVRIADYVSDPITAMVERLAATAIWFDPLDLASVWADTAGITAATVGGAVARIDAQGAKLAPHWQDTAANRPILRADGIEYNGTNDRLVYLDDPELRFGTNSFTVAFALNPDTVTGIHYGIDKRGGTLTGWGVRQQDDDVMMVFGPSGLYVANNVLAIGTWSRVIVEFDRAAAKAKCYFNGVLQGLPPTLPAGDISGTQPVTIGAASNGTYLMDGKLGRVLVINQLLSAGDRTTVDDWLAAGYGG